jgi:LuxR family transcriptional regulator
MELPASMNLKDCRSRLADLAPAGCYVALRVGFYAPEAELNLFSTGWIDHYTISGHALSDPLLLWCQSNEGCTRWSDIDGLDLANVLRDYQSFGYRFGSVVSIRGNEAMRKRSLGIFARNDREPYESEMDEIREIVLRLHSYEPKPMTNAQLEALRLYSQGFLQKQIAHELKISVGAVKARLRGGADRLGAKTPREAAIIATSRGLL